MELNKCPNCSGKLELSDNRNRLVCKYCGSEFTLDDTTRKEVGDSPVSKDWFVYEWDYKKLLDNPNTAPTVSAFVRTLNDYDSSEKIVQYMRDYLLNFNEISAPGIREENMRDIVNRISGNLQTSEKIILYNDDGIFVHGKTGKVITDKRVLFIEKKTVREIMHVNIPYLLFGYSMGLPQINIGEKYSNSIGIFNSHFDLQGVATALICTLSFEQKPDRPKIRLMDSLK